MSRICSPTPVITSAHIAKGLEFDVVVVPHADTANYASDMDRCMLYIACTRAMHELYLTYGGALSRFLDFASDPEESAFAHAR
ncbi:ATP-binding domain-containing protein [Rhodococcus sp. 27YEA6]|uniref:ATP-binding domain-containing protein n=1 Tax=Rhodococcus sp. 27YEA6 TaxID=3156273 RepID=UPI002FDC919D